MAIPYIEPNNSPRFSDLLGIMQQSFQARLAEERMKVEDARERQLMEQRREQNERHHQQQMAQLRLEEMKTNFNMAQSAPGGLDYVKTMSGVDRDNAAISQMASASRENDAQAAYYQQRAMHPERFRGAGSTGKLTAAQMKQNQSDYANGRPLTYPQPTSSAPTSDYLPAPTDYSGGPDQPPLPDPYTSGPQAPLIDGSAPLFPGDTMPEDSGAPIADNALPPEPPAGVPDSGYGLLPPPYTPRSDPQSRGILDKEKAAKAKELTTDIAKLTKDAAVADSSAVTAAQANEPDKAAAYKTSADLFAAQLKQKQEELRNMVDPPQVPTAEPVPEGTPVSAPQQAQAAPAAPAVQPAPPPVSKMAPEDQEFWSRSKDNVLKSIGGREAIAERIKKLSAPIPNLAAMQELIASMLPPPGSEQSKGIPGYEELDADKENFFTNRLPKGAKSTDDVAKALAEDIFRGAPPASLMAGGKTGRPVTSRLVP